MCGAWVSDGTTRWAMARAHLDGVHIVSDDDQLGLLGLDQVGHMVQTELDGGGRLAGSHGLALSLGLQRQGSEARCNSAMAQPVTAEVVEVVVVMAAAVVAAAPTAAAAGRGKRTAPALLPHAAPLPSQQLSPPPQPQNTTTTTTTTTRLAGRPPTVAICTMRWDFALRVSGT